MMMLADLLTNANAKRSETKPLQKVTKMTLFLF